MDDMTMMSVQCNIILNNGYVCGLPPIGRCATCQRAFCMSHQACDRNSYGQVISTYVDMCATCLEVKNAKAAEREMEAKKAYAQSPHGYFAWGAARTALLNSRVPSVAIYKVEQLREWKKGIFGRGVWEETEVATLIGHGWILGEFKWNYNDSGLYGGTSVVRNWLTALLDISDNDPRWYNSPHYGSKGGHVLIDSLLECDRFPPNVFDL